MDPDLGRSFDQFAAFAEAAAERGMQTTLEFAKSLALTDLDTAVAAVRHVGRADFRLLIDTMHVVRSGSTAADLAALDPSLFGYVQLCDSTLEQRNQAYRDDSSDRSVPGEGCRWSISGRCRPRGALDPRRAGHAGRECARWPSRARAVCLPRSGRSGLTPDRPGEDQLDDPRQMVAMIVSICSIDSAGVAGV